jgi:DNA-binding NtrC family response regulator
MAGEGGIAGARVLILEDEYLIADDLARALRDAGAIAVGPVNKLEQAEVMVRGRKVDAAIVDLNLRGVMASEFARSLSETGLPCLIVSGYGGDAVPEAVSGIARLEKPVSPAAVIEALVKVLEGAKSGAWAIDYDQPK